VWQPAKWFCGRGAATSRRSRKYVGGAGVNPYRFRIRCSASYWSALGSKRSSKRRHLFREPIIMQQVEFVPRGTFPTFSSSGIFARKVGRRWGELSLCSTWNIHDLTRVQEWLLIAKLSCSTWNIRVTTRPILARIKGDECSTWNTRTVKNNFMLKPLFHVKHLASAFKFC